MLLIRRLVSRPIGDLISGPGRRCPTHGEDSPSSWYKEASAEFIRDPGCRLVDIFHRGCAASTLLERSREDESSSSSNTEEFLLPIKTICCQRVHALHMIIIHGVTWKVSHRLIMEHRQTVTQTVIQLYGPYNCTVYYCTCDTMTLSCLDRHAQLACYMY